MGCKCRQAKKNFKNKIEEKRNENQLEESSKNISDNSGQSDTDTEVGGLSPRQKRIAKRKKRIEEREKRIAIRNRLKKG